MEICRRCAGILESPIRGQQPLVANSRHPYVIRVFGLPASRCPRCGEESVDAEGRRAADILYDQVTDGLGRAHRQLGRHNQGAAALLDPGRVGVIDLRLGPAGDAGAGGPPDCLRLIESEGPRFEDAVLEPALRGRVGELIAFVRGRERMVGCLGPALRQAVRRTLVSLHGPPGSGKNFVAELVARELGQPLLVLDYGAVLCSRIGDTEKQLSAAFSWLGGRPALLMIDEADGLVSRRLAAENGHEQAMNGIRNHLIQLLNRHDGVVLFATNLRHTYDPALARRMEEIHVPAPGPATRCRLWAHLISQAPTGIADTSSWPATLEEAASERIGKLPQERPLSAADIERVVVRAVGRALDADGGPAVTLGDLRSALDAHLDSIRTACQVPRSAPGQGDGKPVEVVLDAIMEQDLLLLRGLQQAEAAMDEGRCPHDSFTENVNATVKALAIAAPCVAELRRLLASRAKALNHSGVRWNAGSRECEAFLREMSAVDPASARRTPPATPIAQPPGR